MKTKPMSIGEKFINNNWLSLLKCNENQNACYDQHRGPNLHYAASYINDKDFVTARYIINKWGDNKLLKAFDRISI